MAAYRNEKSIFDDFFHHFCVWFRAMPAQLLSLSGQEIKNIDRKDGF